MQCLVASNNHDNDAKGHAQTVRTQQQQAPTDIIHDTAPDVLRDVDGDGYFETTQWVATQDTSGRAQGVLVLDRNNNGLIETNDILQLGGSGNEHNSLAWLDANGDGKLDARDPAFAAIKVWVDCNHNGQVHAGTLIVHEGYDGKTRTTTAYAIPAPKTCKRSGLRGSFTKSLRTNCACSPRGTVAYSYEVCSK